MSRLVQNFKDGYEGQQKIGRPMQSPANWVKLNGDLGEGILALCSKSDEEDK
jgi:hypothetical protein